MQDRASRLVGDIPRQARVIEIGPSFNPLAPKADGWNTTVIDHETREGLVEKYRVHAAVDTSRIEEVDFVWHGGSLADLLGEEGRGAYDAFVASHVIEHVPDIVSFLQSARALLKADGLVVLAVPDKRTCFDLFRSLSSTADAIVAFREKRARHSARTHFDYAAYVAHRAGAPAWAAGTPAPALLGMPLEDAYRYMDASLIEAYVDAHAWTFVPASFELMMLELAAIGLIDLRVESCEATHAGEFLVRLRCGWPDLGADEVHARRHALLNRILVEQAEAVLPAPGPEAGGAPKPEIQPQAQPEPIPSPAPRERRGGLVGRLFGRDRHA